jgi:asparagine synthetase B (glutamine-hydrolysing)
MFAFAILDLRQGKVHLARDRMGEKPLLYALLDGNLAFGSLVRSVLPLPAPACPPVQPSRHRRLSGAPLHPGTGHSIRKHPAAGKRLLHGG